MWLRYSLLNLTREWRSGELYTITLAIILAVTATTAISFFTDRIYRAMQSQAGELIAADLLVQSNREIPDEWLQLAVTRNLKTAFSTTFASVVVHGEQTKLASVKAVSALYPLRGQLRTSQLPFETGTGVAQGPAEGHAWVDSSLYKDLGLRLGDRVQVGSLELTVSQILAYEPDRGGEFFNVAPRLMMHVVDVARTELIQVGSRVQYHLLIAGPQDEVDSYRAALKPLLNESDQIQGAQDARPELKSAIERGRRFLGLAALVSVLLAGVAVAIAARRYAVRHFNNVAIMRCFGAQKRFITRLYFSQITGLGIFASAIGCLLGYITQFFLAQLLSGLLGGKLPAPSWTPVVIGNTIGLMILYGFALPPLASIRNAAPLNILRRQVAAASPSSLLVYASALSAMILLVIWQAGEWTLALYFILGAMATVLLLSACAWILIKLLLTLRGQIGIAWRFGLNNVARHKENSTVQIMGFGLGIMALLLLTIIRNDLLDDWQSNLPEDAPNQFAINIQKSQLDPLKAFYQSQALSVPTFYPMVRGRLVAINGRSVGPADYDSPRAKHLVAREFNLSWSTALPQGNTLASGQWWSENPGGSAQFSVETGIAKRLGIHLGDELTYQIAGELVKAPVTNLRTVNWDSLRPNFFVLSAPGMLEAYPSSYIASFYLPGNASGFLTRLLKKFSNITIINVDALMTQVRSIMDRISSAIQFVFYFTLMAGLLVLYAAIQSTQDQRLYEGAILRTIGANRTQLLIGMVSEFTTIGFLAGAMASAGATVIGYAIAERVLNMDFVFHGYWWVYGVLGGAVGIGLAGTLATRNLLSQPPLHTLRRYY